MASVCRELKVTANVPFGNSDFSLAGKFPFYALTLENPSWKEWRPGQFVMMRTLWGNGGAECAIALPICRVTQQGTVFFFRNGGDTARLVRLKQGDRVLVWGPLGNGFAFPAAKQVLLLASEEGIAPFAGYADRLADKSRIFMFFGHRLPTACYPFDAMASHIDMEEMPDSGDGEHGSFYASMFEKMEKFRSVGGTCLACGPMDFIRVVWRKSLEIGLPAQLFLSMKMICGVGACWGCVVSPGRNADDGGLPLRTCVNGPVFRAEDINLETVLQGGSE